MAKNLVKGILPLTDNETVSCLLLQPVVSSMAGQ